MGASSPAAAGRHCGTVAHLSILAFFRVFHSLRLSRVHHLLALLQAPLTPGPLASRLCAGVFVRLGQRDSVAWCREVDGSACLQGRVTGHVRLEMLPLLSCLAYGLPLQGANDGLVSTSSLLMGVGAASRWAHQPGGCTLRTSSGSQAADATLTAH